MLCIHSSLKDVQESYHKNTDVCNGQNQQQRLVTNDLLTHWGRVTHICISKITIIGSDNLNQCWNMVNGTLRNKLQWNINRNSYIFIQENAFENVICEMMVILSRPQCVNTNPQVHEYKEVDHQQTWCWPISLVLLQFLQKLLGLI